MAGSLSDFMEKKVLDNIFSQVAMPTLTTIWCALLTDANTATQRDANTVTEVSTGTWTNYQRASVTNNATNFPATTGVVATKNNGTAIGPAAFLSSGTTIAASGPVTITAIAFYDAATVGNMIGWCDLAASKTVSNGDTFTLPATTGFTATLD